jgi:hypothetical protein
MAVERKFQGAAAASVSTRGLILAGIAVLSIWISVAIATVYAPDFVSGSQQDHLALVPWTDWVWGLVATGFVVLAALQGLRTRVVAMAPWTALAAGCAVVWAAVAIVSVSAPVFVTGTDPTRIPMGALGIPIVGVFLTWFVCTFVKTLFDQYKA